MNAVEIEEAVSALVAEPFNASEFPYQFLTAFGFKDTTVKKLKAGASSTSDVPGAVLLRSNIHLIVTDPGKTTERLLALKASQKTAKGKVKFVLATDGEMVEAEELATGEPLACPYTELASHFGFFLPLAGISTVAEIKDNPIDIKATGRLNKLYLELLKDNEDWGSDAKRQELNQFMARLIFCFFAEDTGIFLPGLFTSCLKQMTDPQSSNTHEVIQKLFQAMDTPIAKRKDHKFPSWADQFPYVNGRLFTEQTDVPHFSKMARSYLLRAGELDWQQINPDIFGSMIQAVADDDERGSLGMHYTSVPNILKVLDPLFLDDLREQLDEAADNPRKLLNLRKRIAAVRVFDPACGSGNFLVISYIKLREIEAEIIRRRKDEDKKSWIKLTSFYGIEIKSFPAEIARLALLIAEFQSNVRHIGQREACLDVLPLHDTGKIVTGNALRLDWTEVCPPPKAASTVEEDLAGPTGRLALDAEAEATTFVCGNPPYRGYSLLVDSQKQDLELALEDRVDRAGFLDYIAGWFIKAVRFAKGNQTTIAFVTTNSICQGQLVPILWPPILEDGFFVHFAHTSFKWSNLAANKAGVTVAIVGLSQDTSTKRRLFTSGDEGSGTVIDAKNINAYLVNSSDVIVDKRATMLSGCNKMDYGSKPVDGGFLTLTQDELVSINIDAGDRARFVRKYVGSDEAISGTPRYCVWVTDADADDARKIPSLNDRFLAVKAMRLASTKKATVVTARRPFAFQQVRQSGTELVSIVPIHTSENRRYLPFALLPKGSIVSNAAFAILDAPLWNLAIIGSRLHLIWIATVCGKIKTDFRYSNLLGWNTFPVPTLTENDKAALTRCAEDILLAREAHFPATIADLYEPEQMPADLRDAHDRNDETLERIYIGRRFKNDTERLERLFDMYTKMTKDEEARKPTASVKNGRKSKTENADTGDQA